MVIMLPTPTLLPPEITEDDYYLSYCPRPPGQLVIAEGNDEIVIGCYSISPSGERQDVPKHRCIFCASFKETISAINEDGKLFLLLDARGGARRGTGGGKYLPSF
jgi:hypothetical protein